MKMEYDPWSLSYRVEFRNLWNREELFDHQEYVRRYMAPHTSNDSILLFHNLGSGKTLTCISISVDHYEARGTKTVVITKSVHGHYIFYAEIEKYKKMHGHFDDRAIFSMKSYIEFHNRLREMTNDDICEKYSHTIIVMDEIHNIRYHKVNVDSVYQQLLRLVTIARDVRLILSTATPMTDNVDQIESILQLFANRHIAISYNTTTRHVAETTFYGEPSYRYFFPVVKIPMSPHQAQFYDDLYRQNVNNDIYRSLSQVSLFCSLDGMYGRHIMTHVMMRSSLAKHIVTSSGKHRDINCTMYRVKERYVPDITDHLHLTSCKYSYLLSRLEADDGTFFVFLEDVLGSGVIVLAEVLRLRGYEAYLGDDVTRLRPALRYTFCVGTTDLCPNMEDRIEGFNHPINKDGEYIKIVIGSRVLGESITLKNVRNFHCLIPHWNDSIVTQALGRVVRSKSHDDLDETERHVKVHIYCSMLDGEGAPHEGAPLPHEGAPLPRQHARKKGSPRDTERALAQAPPVEPPRVESIDQKKIRISNVKRSKIREMIETLKEYSIERYTLHDPIEHDTYYVDDFIRYYLSRYVPVLLSYLENMFESRTSYTVQEIEETLNIDRKITRHFLIKCIANNMTLCEKYILRTFKNRVFVIPIVSENGQRNDDLPYVTLGSRGKIETKHLIPIDIIQKIPEKSIVGETPAEILMHIRTTMNARELEYILEKESVQKTNQSFLDLMRHVLLTLDSEDIVHTLCYTKNYDVSYKASIPIPSKASGLRILKKGTTTWETCTQERETQLLHSLRNQFEALLVDMDTQHPIYGIVSTIDMQMRLSIKITESGTRDRRLKHRGRMISTFTKANLFMMRYILSNDIAYNDLYAMHDSGIRFRNLHEIYNKYSDKNETSVVRDNNATLIRDIEQLIIRRNIFIVI